MRKRVLDTSILILHWRTSRGGSSLDRSTEDDARTWAHRLIALEKADAIVTPVYVEMICGVRGSHELLLTTAYLHSFRVIDGGNVLPEDWREAIRLARRVPRNGKPRQLGDCLVRAISDRLNHNVRTVDQGFPR